MVEDVRANARRHLVEASGLQPDVAAPVEKGCYNSAIRFAKARGILRHWSDDIFLHVYLHRVHSVSLAVTPGSYVFNERLRNDLVDGRVDPGELAKLSPEAAFPEVWAEVRGALREKEIRELQPRILVTTSRFRCPKCKKSECSFYEMQIRSGDEPSTVFVSCLPCGHKWRMN
jgi:DNA-directed RNA polymerase subunit M/transcription elongation factor TFIIS